MGGETTGEWRAGRHPCWQCRRGEAKRACAEGPHTSHLRTASTWVAWHTWSPISVICVALFAAPVGLRGVRRHSKQLATHTASRTSCASTRSYPFMIPPPAITCYRTTTHAGLLMPRVFLADPENPAGDEAWEEWPDLHTHWALHTRSTLYYKHASHPGPTRSWIFVPLLHAAVGRLCPEALQAWQSDHRYGALWSRALSQLRSAGCALPASVVHALHVLQQLSSEKGRPVPLTAVIATVSLKVLISWAHLS